MRTNTKLVFLNRCTQRFCAQTVKVEKEVRDPSKFENLGAKELVKELDKWIIV